MDDSTFILIIGIKTVIMFLFHLGGDIVMRSPSRIILIY